VAVAVLQAAGQAAPTVTGDADACTIRFADGVEDRICWQSHEDRLLRGARVLESGDALLSMVRTHNGKLVGYVMGEGTKLRWQGRTLVEAKDSVCVSAGPGGTEITGRRRPYEGLPPLPPEIVTLKKP
jgi:hypothetical protein